MLQRSRFGKTTERTQRNTLSPPEAGATLNEYSIRDITEKINYYPLENHLSKVIILLSCWFI